MFADIFDSVRTQITNDNIKTCQDNAVHSELSLFSMLLAGEKPNLTPAQIIDSAAFFAMTSANQKTFVKLVSDEFLTLTLFEKERSLRHHFLYCLAEGVTNNNSLYTFSVFPFLDDYPVEIRKSFQHKMITAIQEQTTDFQHPDIKKADSEFMETVFDNFQIIDVLSRKMLKKTRVFTKDMSEIILKMCSEVQNNTEFSSFFDELKKHNNGETVKTKFRSTYYDYIKQVSQNYSNETISQFKDIVDTAYNIAIASTIDDTEGSEITSLTKAVHNSNTLSELNPSKVAKTNISILKNPKTAITWENMYDILTEVRAIEIEKKVSRKEALKIYQKKQSLLSVFDICKYSLVSGLKALVPGAGCVSAAVNIVTDIATNAGTEILDTRLKNYSITELFAKQKQRNNNISIAKQTIEHLEYNLAIYPKL